MTNSYTLSPVPGAILHAGGRAVLVECNKDTYQIDIESLVNTQVIPWEFGQIMSISETPIRLTLTMSITETPIRLTLRV